MAAERLLGGRFERFLLRHGRQDSRKPRSEHRLPGAGRSEHEHAVASGCGDFQGALCMVLPLHLAIVVILHRASGKKSLPVCVSRVQRNRTIEKCHGFGECVERIRRHALYHGRFLAVLSRQEQTIVWPTGYPNG